MSTPTVFGIYGGSNTGKTSLIEKLVLQLTQQGFRIATIKQTKKAISLDLINKDTWRHHKAGADLVVFSSSCETDLLLNKALKTSEIIQKISGFGCYDLILIEGSDDFSIPKIKIGTGKKRNNTIATYKDNMKDILILIKKELKKKLLPQRINIIVNGKNIPVTKFPEQIIANTIVGMLSSLKGIQDINQVTIDLKR